MVRDRYGLVARQGSSCCGPTCCSPEAPQVPAPAIATKLGYSDDELAAVPEGANLGLGCGNPQAIAALTPGETVLDLGAGAGFDCFLAARQVGPEGRVIGVDMTPDMLAKAKENAEKLGAKNVEFREGTIEALPVEDACVDVILSNCVINLSPDKPAVFREAMRVLRPGGRLAISDVVALRPLPATFRESPEIYASCAGGAATVDELTSMLKSAGFEDILIVVNPESRAFIAEWLPGSQAEDYVASASIEGRKPKERTT
jgi:SAM-dependent methyltransferase